MRSAFVLGRRTTSLAALLLVPALAAGAALGQQPAPAPATSLTPLPRMAPTALPAAEPSAVAELDAWLARLTGADEAGRKAAVASIDGTSSSMVPAIAKKLADLRKSAKVDPMAVVIASARRKQADADDDAPKKRRKGDDAKDGHERDDAADWLDRVMAKAAPDQPAWRDATTLLGLERMLARIATTPALRELCALYPAWGELLRIDLQRQVQRLGDKAVPALVEARRADAAKLRLWAAKQLDVMGKTVPGEAVQTNDNQVLAEVLRAYGRTRDEAAARVIVSFANSDRVMVRDAAREAVAQLADAALWQLRESYESLTGKNPPQEWGWERTAEELFAAYDRSRLAEVYATFDEGLAAFKAGKLDEMASAWDRVLARAPTFERRAEMVAGYEKLARDVEVADRPRALALFRRTLRIDPSGARARPVAAEVAFLEAEELAARGVVDPDAYRRVVDLDPDHAAARAALDRIQQGEEVRDAAMRRYAIAAAIALIAIIGSSIALLRRRA